MVQDTIRSPSNKSRLTDDCQTTYPLTTTQNNHKLNFNSLKSQLFPFHTSFGEYQLEEKKVNQITNTGLIINQHTINVQNAVATFQVRQDRGKYQCKSNTKNKAELENIGKLTKAQQAYDSKHLPNYENNYYKLLNFMIMNNSQLIDMTMLTSNSICALLTESRDATQLHV
jgi:hypothetical protein